MVNNTKVLDTVQVLHFVPASTTRENNNNDNSDDDSDDSDDSDASDGTWESGTAIKLEGTRWRVILPGGKESLVAQQELLDKRSSW